MKNIRNSLFENFHFLVLNFSVYMKRHVLVMCKTAHVPSEASDQPAHNRSLGSLCRPPEDVLGPWLPYSLYIFVHLKILPYSS